MTEIENAQLAVDVAYELYLQAVLDYNNDSGFRIRTKKNLDAARLILDEAQQNFQAKTGFYAYEVAQSNNEFGFVPVVCVGVFASFVLFYALKTFK